MKLKIVKAGVLFAVGAALGVLVAHQPHYPAGVAYAGGVETLADGIPVLDETDISSTPDGIGFQQDFRLAAPGCVSVFRRGATAGGAGALIVSIDGKEIETASGPASPVEGDGAVVPLSAGYHILFSSAAPKSAHTGLQLLFNARPCAATPASVHP